MPEAAPKYHGVKLEDSGRSGKILFGIEALIAWVFVTYRLPANGNRPEWPNYWLDRKFDQACQKFRETLFKFDRAAGYAAKSSKIAGKFYDGQPLEELAASQNALSDLPMYLDMVLVYFRVQADCIANIIPNLYGKDGHKVHRDSFRKQVRWYTEKRPDFDPSYKTLLDANSKWLGVLSDFEGGAALRESVIHRRGTYQLGYSTDRFGISSDTVASLLNESGFLCEDVMASVKHAFADYCRYLDAVYLLFKERIEKATSSAILPDPNRLTLFTFEGGLKSTWVYPEISSSRALPSPPA